MVTRLPGGSNLTLKLKSSTAAPSVLDCPPDLSDAVAGTRQDAFDDELCADLMALVKNVQLNRMQSVSPFACDETSTQLGQQRVDWDAGLSAPTAIAPPSAPPPPPPPNGAPAVGPPSVPGIPGSSTAGGGRRTLIKAMTTSKVPTSTAAPPPAVVAKESRPEFEDALMNEEYEDWIRGSHDRTALFSKDRATNVPSSFALPFLISRFLPCRMKFMPRPLTN